MIESSELNPAHRMLFAIGNWEYQTPPPLILMTLKYKFVDKEAFLCILIVCSLDSPPHMGYSFPTPEPKKDPVHVFDAFMFLELINLFNLLTQITIHVHIFSITHFLELGINMGSTDDVDSHLCSYAPPS